MNLKELLKLQPGDLLLGLTPVMEANISYLTINQTGWSEDILSPPPVFYIKDAFMEKCLALRHTNLDNLNNSHLLANYLSISTRDIRGDLKYLCVPDVSCGDMIGMSLGTTICMYEHAPSAEMYRTANKYVFLKIYHKVLYRDMILWLHMSLAGFVENDKPLNDKLKSDIMETNVRLK